MEFWDGSGISWTICKQSAPRSRQITTPAAHHSIFTGQMLFQTPNQQCQNTEGRYIKYASHYLKIAKPTGCWICPGSARVACGNPDTDRRRCRCQSSCSWQRWTLCPRSAEPFWCRSPTPPSPRRSPSHSDEISLSICTHEIRHDNDHYAGCQLMEGVRGIELK